MELCPCLFLWLSVPCSPVNQQCLLLTGTREKFAQRTNSPVRKETEGTSEEEGGGRDHTSWRQRCGRGCLSPRNSSNSCLHAGTGSHSHFCFPDTALAHHPHDDTEITLGIRDCLSLGSIVLCPDPSISHLASLQVKEVRECNKLHFLSLEYSKKLIKHIKYFPSIHLHSVSFLAPDPSEFGGTKIFLSCCSKGGSPAGSPFAWCSWLAQRMLLTLTDTTALGVGICLSACIYQYFSAGS